MEEHEMSSKLVIALGLAFTGWVWYLFLQNPSPTPYQWGGIILMTLITAFGPWAILMAHKQKKEVGV